MLESPRRLIVWDGKLSWILHTSGQSVGQLQLHTAIATASMSLCHGYRLMHYALHHSCPALTLLIPFSRKYSGWGNMVDDLVTSSAWRRMHDISAEEGLVAIAFERKHGQWR